MAKNFYETLGVSRSATDKDIRSAYRKLARKLHPDVNPNDKASEERFKEVNAAYDVLSDPDKRKKYDRYGDNWEHADELDRAARSRAGAGRTRYYYSNSGGGPDFGPNVEFGSEGDLGDILGGFFGRRGGGRPGRPRDLNVEQPVEITLEEAFNGTTRMMLLDTADGAGVPRRIEVKIPAGVTTGSRVRVAGEGREDFDGRKGDLFLVVTVRPHDGYERRGDDLYADVEVPLTEAVLGGEAAVQALDKRVALKIPPLTQNGRVFRLGGLGMPRLTKPDTRGDLYARIKVKLPEQLGDDERRLFEELKAAGI